MGAGHVAFWPGSLVCLYLAAGLDNDNGDNLTLNSGFDFSSQQRREANNLEARCTATHKVKHDKKVHPDKQTHP
ncbi:hypothetical protein EV126DRAFT_417835 [Verticillium dahliae]|nr:hypothetical protein EV126DRAFT_417835 [Verticillium dahliae]